MIQKTIAAVGDDNLTALFVNQNRIHCAYGGFPALFVGGECLEIMRSHQTGRRSSHGIQIKRFWQFIHISAQEYTRKLLIPDAVAIGLSLCVEPAVKPLWHLLDCNHANVLWQVLVDIIHHRCRWQFCVNLKIRHLPKCVNAGIRAPGAIHLHEMKPRHFRKNGL